MTAHLKLLEQDVPALLDERHFTGLREEAERLAQVVNNLLFFARPLPVVRETCRLADLLREEAEMAGHEWPEVSVEVDCPEDLTVEADWETLGRAIRNLARNALEASGASDDGSGRVRFSARSAEKRVTITVEDNGPGLDAEVRQNLFTPFTSQKPGGTGLGLAIARKIIREHGGGLEAVESELGGAGFAIVLPEAGD
jgi:signal transduction histidine kinase